MESPVAVPAGDYAAVDAVASLQPLKKIWDCDMIERGANARGDFIWTCKHCDQQFAGNNATKAVHHVLKKKGQNIKLCTAAIPSMYLLRYEDFYESNVMTRRARKTQSVSFFLCCLLYIFVNTRLTTLFRLI